jgi:hypothetical protein
MIGHLDVKQDLNGKESLELPAKSFWSIGQWPTPNLKFMLNDHKTH